MHEDLLTGGIGMQNLERMRELIQTIQEADEAYYKYDAPIMADLDYDRLYDELVDVYKRQSLETGVDNRIIPSKHLPVTRAGLAISTAINTAKGTCKSSLLSRRFLCRCSGSRRFRGRGRRRGIRRSPLFPTRPVPAAGADVYKRQAGIRKLSLPLPITSLHWALSAWRFASTHSNARRP